jgi:hypothetical protein
MDVLPECKCGRGPVMPSTVRRRPTGGSCKHCHWERVKRYRATVNGKKSAAEVQKRFRSKVRSETIAAYGGGCSCCGEAEPLFLTVDHINNNGGGRDRTKGGIAFWMELRRLGFPKDEYRILCWNCNSGRQLNKGICPHEKGGKE